MKRQGVERTVDAVVAAVELLHRGDLAGAERLLFDAVAGDVDDAFAAACGLAYYVAARTVGSGPVRAQVRLRPGSTRTHEDLSCAVAAFIAAVGNADYDGAAQVFYADRPIAGRILAILFANVARLESTNYDGTPGSSVIGALFENGTGTGW